MDVNLLRLIAARQGETLKFYLEARPELTSLLTDHQEKFRTTFSAAPTLFGDTTLDSITLKQQALTFAIFNLFYSDLPRIVSVTYAPDHMGSVAEVRNKLGEGQRIFPAAEHEAFARAVEAQLQQYDKFVEASKTVVALRSDLKKLTHIEVISIAVRKAFPTKEEYVLHMKNARAGIIMNFLMQCSAIAAVADHKLNTMVGAARTYSKLLERVLGPFELEQAEEIYRTK